VGPDSAGRYQFFNRRAFAFGTERLWIVGREKKLFEFVAALTAGKFIYGQNKLLVKTNSGYFFDE